MYVAATYIPNHRMLFVKLKRGHVNTAGCVIENGAARHIFPPLRVWCSSRLWVNGWAWLATAHYDLGGGVSWAWQIWPHFPSCCRKLNGSHVALKAQSLALVFIWWNGTSVMGNRMCVACVWGREREREDVMERRQDGKKEIRPSPPQAYWQGKWERSWEMIRS